MMNHVYHERNLPSVPSKDRREENEGSKGYLSNRRILLSTTAKKKFMYRVSTDARIAYPTLPLARSTVCLSASYCCFFSKPQNGDFSLTERTQIVGCKEPQ